jgi:hypothetical protein
MPTPSASTTQHDPTPALARQVLALFRQELEGVQFPELDLDVLESAEQAMLAAQLEVERIEAQLEAARIARAEQVAELETKAERALAYARVYASGDAELSARVAELGRKKVAGGAAADTPVKKRGRPKKGANGAELFGDSQETPAADGGKPANLVLAS